LPPSGGIFLELSMADNPVENGRKAAPVGFAQIWGVLKQ